MHASKNKVVTFHYTITNGHGEIKESSREIGAPSVYLHGANNIMPALEKALEGKSAGESISVTLTPAEAYGERKPNMTQRVPAKYLKHEGKLKVGQAVRIQTDKGSQAATVLKVGKFNVDVDFNHPLAGQTVTFNIELIEIRDASAEEIAHGHAHGPGGHHH